MIIVGKEGCPQCKILRAAYTNIGYIEIPSKHIGLGDTICAITCFFNIQPCKTCMVRRHWCNEYIPYIWNIKTIDPSIIELKQTIIELGITRYPVLMNDRLDKVLPLEDLPGFTNLFRPR